MAQDNFQISILKLPFRRGFTFIEALLYVAIMALMLTALIPFMGNIMVGNAQSMVQQEVSSNARIVSEKIKYEIRKATTLTSASGSTLILGSTTIDCPSDQVRINSVPINSLDTTVTNLVFENLTTGVRFSFTISSKFNQTRKEYQSSMNVEGAAQLRI